eukprot:3154848-Pleurochrysis_carterae.AAC.2
MTMRSKLAKLCAAAALAAADRDVSFLSSGAVSSRVSLPPARLPTPLPSSSSPLSACDEPTPRAIAARARTAQPASQPASRAGRGTPSFLVFVSAARRGRRAATRRATWQRR